jgi:hypothetical protein
MPDQKSPRSFGDYRQVLTLLLQYQRDSLARKVFGVSEVAARQSRVPSGTTLLWLIEHLAYAERLWIMHRFVGGEKPVPITTHRTVDSPLAAYRGSWADVDAVIAAAPSLDELSVIADDRGHVTLRWIIAHLLGNRPPRRACRHTARADRWRHRPLVGRSGLISFGGQPSRRTSGPTSQVSSIRVVRPRRAGGSTPPQPRCAAKGIGDHAGWSISEWPYSCHALSSDVQRRARPRAWLPVIAIGR